MKRRDFALFAASSVLAATDAAANPVAAPMRGKKFEGGVYFVSGNAHHTAAGASFDVNGVTEKPWWEITSVGESFLTFHKSGTGKCIGRTYCKITSIHDETQKQNLGSLLATEVATWSYEFSYNLMKNNEISIVVNPGSWQGKVIGGSRTGKRYVVSVNPDRPQMPLVTGYLSADFTKLQLISSDPVSVVVTDRNGGPVEYGRKILSLYGFLFSERPSEERMSRDNLL